MKGDAELIARVLDGRATPEERARVLAEADQSPELLELLADSAAAMGGEADVVSLSSRRTTRRLTLGIGAALAAAGLFFLWPRGGESGVPPFPASVTVTNVGPAREGASVASLRGSSDGDRLLQSVIIGARLTDYRLLGADTARGTAALEIVTALRAIPGGAIAATNFESAQPLTMGAIAAIERVVDVPAFRSAQWLELARVAALAGDRDILERQDLRDALAKMEGSRRSQLSEQVAAGELRRIAELASEALVALARSGR